MRTPLALLFLILALKVNPQNSMRVMFWNVENLFDCIDDPEKEDDEFLPSSPRHWTFFRYRQKLINVSKVIMAVGEGEIPALVGMCEVENDTVMEDLLRLTPLGKLGYRYYITASPDRRGINVALLYKRDRFRPLSRNDIRIEMPGKRRPTRDILHITGLIPSLDTLDLFICHFPSRSGGEKESRPARNAAKKRLREVINRVHNIRSKPLSIIMGDLNDYPETLDLSGDLELSTLVDKPVDNFLINLVNDNLYALMQLLPKNEKGSHKYDGSWGYLDHFIVNGTLLNQSISPSIRNWGLFSAPFLLTDDTKHFGKRPKRTFYGYRYEGGYSDHLPIKTDIWWEE